MNSKPDNIEEITCGQCGKTLIPKPTVLRYLGHVFRVDIPACPECGQVYISEDLVKGRMAEVEMELEDK